MALAEITYTHTGNRYVLGYGPDFYGIWDRESPAEPTSRYPRTTDGWAQAWQRYAGLEPAAVAVAAAPTVAPPAPPVGWTPTPAGWQPTRVGGTPNPLAPIGLALAVAGAAIAWFWSALVGLVLAVAGGIVAGIARRRIRATGGSGMWMVVVAQIVLAATVVMFVLMLLSVFGTT